MRDSMMVIVAAGLLVCLLAAPCGAQSDSPQPSGGDRSPQEKEMGAPPERLLKPEAEQRDENELDGPFAFGFLKKLAGDWEGRVGSEEGPAASAVFRVGAVGNVLIVTELPGTADELVGVFSLDGRDLVATIYSGLGTQPRLRFNPRKSYPGKYQFEFAGGVNVDKTKEAHFHEGSIQFTGLDRIRAEWVIFKGRARADTRMLLLNRRKEP